MRFALLIAVIAITGCVTIDRALLRTVPSTAGETNIILEPRPEIVTGLKVAGAAAPYPWASAVASGLAILLSGYAAARTRRLKTKPEGGPQ